MISTQALSFRYPDGTEALHEVSLEVSDGAFLAVMGANGSGKTTLLKQLIGLLKPSSGKVILDGEEFHSLRNEEVFRRVGMVFQDPNDQLFSATVEEDVAFGVMNMGLKPEVVRQRVIEALEMVGALDLAAKAIHTLSFGQKRRVAIAGVVAMNPEIMLLDEPTSGLDPHANSCVMRLLRKLNRENGITMVMATHDVELVPLYCDRVAIMDGGRLVREETPLAVFADTDVVREAKLRLPRVAHLVEILKKEDGLDLSGIPLTIGTARQELLKLAESYRQAVAPEYREGVK